MTRCADCGRAIEERPNHQLAGLTPKMLDKVGTVRWAERVGRGWSYTCRADIDGGRLLSADYHHVAGERQRHWRAPR